MVFSDAIPKDGRLAHTGPSVEAARPTRRRACLNVLILSASSKSLLVKAFQDAVRPFGGTVTAADVAADSAALQVADKAVLTPRSNDPRFSDALEAICSAHDISLVVPTRDGELLRLAEIAARLRAKGIAVLVPSREAIDICSNSWRFSAFCRKNGFPTPMNFSTAEAVDRFPVFCRAADRTVPHHAMRLSNKEELSAYEVLHGRVDGGLIIQEFVDWPEYSIDVLMDLQGQPLQAVARRRISTRAGESWKTRVEKLPELTEAALALSELLGLVGHNNLQAFYDPVAGAQFIEVNARFGGASNLSIRSGLASPERLVQMVAGNAAAAAAPRPLNYGGMLLRHAEDIIVDHDPAEDCVSWQDLASERQMSARSVGAKRAGIER